VVNWYQRDGETSAGAWRRGGGGCDGRAQLLIQAFRRSWTLLTAASLDRPSPLSFFPPSSGLFRRPWMPSIAERESLAGSRPETEMKRWDACRVESSKQSPKMTSVDYVRYSVEMCPTARPSGFPAPGTGRKFIIQHRGLYDVYRAGGKRQCVRVIACVSGPWRYLAASRGLSALGGCGVVRFLGSGLLLPDSSSRSVPVSSRIRINQCDQCLSESR
jgi:hypothetical protein